MPPRIRTTLTTIALIVGLAIFALVVNRHYPIRLWLFGLYVQYWLLSAGALLSCFLAGTRVVAWLAPGALRLSERILLSFASGILLFGLGVFVAGRLRLFGSVFFFAWPLVLAATGGAMPWRIAGRVFRRLRRRPTAIWLPQTPLETAAACFLFVGLLAVYSHVLTPENVSWDARWYHLAIAEQYAAQHRIDRFAEGWYLGVYPHLASWLYTWAFQIPGALFDRVALASHVEWMIFLVTVPGVAVLARRMVPGVSFRFGSAALFLFPGILLYDSNLNTGADHVLAFWAVPIAVAVLAALRSATPGRLLLVAIPTAGALLTKYQGIYLAVAAAGVLTIALIRKRRLHLASMPLAAVTVLTAPHWLKNWLWYGDPLYPLLHRHLNLRPFHAGAAYAFQKGGYFPSDFILEGGVLHKAWLSLQALATFSFVPNDWDMFHRDVPVFGSLFTLLVLALPLVRAPRRLWGLIVATHVGIFIWYYTNHQDRFLQSLLPWMAACVAASIVLIWRSSFPARLALVALIGFQIVWGSDVYFFRTHSMTGETPIKSLADFIAYGHKKKYRSRFRRWENLDKVTQHTPAEAKVLIHDRQTRLGLQRAAVVDAWGYQGALAYRELGSTHAVWQAWRDLGVTHVSWYPRSGDHLDQDALARQIPFFDAAFRATHDRKEVEGVMIATLDAQPPDPRPRLLLVHACKEDDPPKGLYRIAGWAGEGSPSLVRSFVEPGQEITVMAVRPECGLPDHRRTELDTKFELATVFDGLELWVRKRPTPAAEPKGDAAASAVADPAD